MLIVAFVQIVRYLQGMSVQACYQPWSFMEIRDLFGDGESSGDLVRVACFGHSSANGATSGCEGRKPDDDCLPPAVGGERVVRVDPASAGLPRETVRTAVSEGADIILEFLPGAIPSDTMLREVASLVRRLRTSGLSLTLTGLATSIRARISRLEASLGRS